MHLISVSKKTGREGGFLGFFVLYCSVDGMKLPSNPFPKNPLEHAHSEKLRAIALYSFQSMKGLFTTLQN